MNPLLTFLLLAMGCPNETKPAESGHPETGVCSGATQSQVWCGPRAGEDGSCMPVESFVMPIEECDVIVCSLDGEGRATLVGDTGSYEACCYPATVDLETGCTEGRPLTVGGSPRLAAVVAGADWGRGGPTSPLPPEVRRMLAIGWSRAGLMEHASVAAFATLSLELLALGAPADLVLDAQRAGADEVRHAAESFALAATFGGEPVGPAPLDLSGVRIGTDLDTLAYETVVEGCIGETLSAALAEAALQRATDPAVRRVLTRIVADERRHAALAWRIVQWALRVGDARVREAVEAGFRAVPTVAEGPEGLTAWGRLGASEARAVIAEAWREVVLPASVRLAA